MAAQNLGVPHVELPIVLSERGSLTADVRTFAIDEKRSRGRSKLAKRVILQFLNELARPGPFGIQELRRRVDRRDRHAQALAFPEQELPGLVRRKGADHLVDQRAVAVSL
jgi:hypothetical protein